MSYKNGREIFPPELLKEIQKYVQGERVYIPQLENVKETWGTKSGTREKITFRNMEIIKQYKQGSSIDELSDIFCLSVDTIKKIVYGKNK